MLRPYFLILTFLFLAGCDNEETFAPQYEVPVEASIHVSAFFKIASTKGLNLDTGNLIVRFEGELNSQDGSPICGNAAGSLTGDRQNVVTIDTECLAWRHSEISREILLFHELGHVFLERAHFDELFSNDDYRSIMYGGNWNIFRFYTENPFKRDYYINELFDPATPTPDWAK
ncbi:MAG: hypothetical protein AAFO69_13735 [Bacteroidota bacterium]